MDRTETSQHTKKQNEEEFCGGYEELERLTSTGEQGVIFTDDNEEDVLWRCTALDSSMPAELFLGHMGHDSEIMFECEEDILDAQQCILSDCSSICIPSVHDCEPVTSSFSFTQIAECRDVHSDGQVIMEITDFLAKNESSICCKFYDTTCHWQCDTIFDGVSFSPCRFDIYLYTGDGEYIITWKRMRGTSPVFAQLFKAMKSEMTVCAPPAKALSMNPVQCSIISENDVISSMAQFSSWLQSHQCLDLSEALAALLAQVSSRPLSLTALKSNECNVLMNTLVKLVQTLASDEHSGATHNSLSSFLLLEQRGGDQTAQVAVQCIVCIMRACSDLHLGAMFAQVVGAASFVAALKVLAGRDHSSLLNANINYVTAV